jgi:hypothetical protein
MGSHGLDGVGDLHKYTIPCTELKVLNIVNQ